jgi:hypothetical protein
MLKNACKEFADKELVPIAHKIDKNHYFPRDHVKKMGDLGLMGLEGIHHMAIYIHNGALEKEFFSFSF